MCVFQVYGPSELFSGISRCTFAEVLYAAINSSNVSVCVAILYHWQYCSVLPVCYAEYSSAHCRRGIILMIKAMKLLSAMHYLARVTEAESTRFAKPYLLRGWVVVLGYDCGAEVFGLRVLYKIKAY